MMLIVLRNNNFVFNMIKKNELDDKNKKPKVLNKGFIMDDQNNNNNINTNTYSKDTDRLSKLNDKINCMIKQHDLNNS
jgi:hypothetical protein